VSSVSMGCAISCLGSICASCAASLACSACKCACSFKCLATKSIANLVYVVLQLTSAILAVSLRYGGVDLNIGADVGIHGVSVCTNTNGTACGNALSFTICNHDKCAGYWAVYRISCTLAIFFLLMMILTACTCKGSVHAHQGYWFAKAVFIVGVLAAILFAPNDMLAVYAWIARFIAPLFLVYQMVCYIDFGYRANKMLRDKDVEGGTWRWRYLMLLICIVLITGSIACIGIMYHYYPPSCAFNVLACTTTLLFGLLNISISISRLSHEEGNIFVSSLIFAYTTYLCYSTLSAMPEPMCNISMSPDGSSETGSLVLSCVIAGLTVGYFAYRMGSKQLRRDSMGSNMMSGKSPGEAGDASSGATDVVTVQVEGDAGKANGEGGHDGGEEVESESFLTYHFVMLIITVYVSMMLTDWGTPAAAQNQKYNLGYASAWLQMSANWICSILYLWTLVAPKLFPNRDFS